MAYLFQLPCANFTGNTGIPVTCTLNPDELIGLLAIPKGTTFTAAQLAAFQTTLQAGLVNDTYGSRYHRIGQFEEIDDQSEDRVQKTFGYQRKVTIQNGKYYWNFRYLDGAFCMHQSLINFRNREQEFDYLIVDKSNNFIGTYKLDATTNAYLYKGVSVTELYENDWKPKTGDDENSYILSMGIRDSAQLNKYMANVTADFDFWALNTVKDVRISSLGALSGIGTVNLGIYAACGGLNLVQTYGSTIANVARFSAKNTATGATITISSVTVGGVGQNSYLIFDMDVSDTDYPAIGSQITIDMVAPSVLVAAGLDYFDGEPLILTVQV